MIRGLRRGERYPGVQASPRPVPSDSREVGHAFTLLTASLPKRFRVQPWLKTVVLVAYGKLDGFSGLCGKAFVGESDFSLLDLKTRD